MDSNINTEAGITRLREEQEKSLNACNQRINQWKQFENDYKSLHNFLGTVGNKLKHDVMVPFGKMAFMPGQLVNTNNVLVLLGDNWFAERSTKEAQGIVERRIQSCQDALSKLEVEKNQAQGWIQHTESALGEEGIKEIIEEYDPVKDVSWRDRRSQRESLLKDDESDVRRPSRSRKSSVRWEDLEKTQPAVISFTHSNKAPPDSLEFETNPNPPTVRSPGDIWNMFGSPTTEQKSILKPARPLPIPVSENVKEDTRAKKPSEISSQAFTGAIVEKRPNDNLEVQKEPPSRPISRFKAQRSKK